MKTKLILTVFLLSILSTLILSVASAQTTQPAQLGVAKGDVFEYSYIVTWNSTDSSLPIPSDVAKLNQTQGFEITITGTSGTTLNAQVLREFRNGTTDVETGFVDVASGSIHLPYGGLIVPANLNVNDKIYPAGGDATINNTSTRTYANGNRQTNEQLVETTSGNHYDKTDVYYDKTKGIAVSSYYESIDTYGSETETYTETITNTNANSWATANAPIASTTTNAPAAGTTTDAPTKSAAFVFSTVDLLAVIAVIIIVLIVVVLVLYGRRRKPKTQQIQTEYLGTF